MAYDVHTGAFRPERAANAGSAAPKGGRRAARPPRPNEWPVWAVPQLVSAAAIAEDVAAAGGHPVLATELYRRWFNPATTGTGRLGRPLAGVYRAAHAGSGVRIERDGAWIVDRNDVVGRDGWWRTWNEAWVPTRGRTEAVRVMFSPVAATVGEFVSALTTALREVSAPWLLACPTDPARLGRLAAATLYLPDEPLPDHLLDGVSPLLQPVAPPLCRPLAPGVALGRAPGNGMSFGEHRCHLLALALRTRAARRDPLRAVADVFRAHGVDPANPWTTSAAW